MNVHAATARKANSKPAINRAFDFKIEHHPGFSRTAYVRLGKASLTISTYAGNWYVALMWA